MLRLVAPLVLLFAAPLAAHGASRRLLARLPAPPAVVVVLERPAQDVALYTRFARELLAALGVDRPFTALEQRLGSDRLERAEAVVLAAFGAANKNQFLALVETDADVDTAPRADSLPALRLDARTVAIGDGDPLHWILNSRDRGGPLTARLPARGAIRIVASPDWLRFAPAGGHDACDVRGRSVSRARAEAGPVTAAAELGGTIDLAIASEARDPVDAEILADAIRATLWSHGEMARGSTADDVARAVESARATAAGSTVKVQMALGAGALDHARKHEWLPRILEWGLEGARRERRESVAEVFDLLALAPGNAAADIGAGYGFFTVRLARAVGPTGRVYAVDLDKITLAGLAQRVRDGGLTNVEAVTGRVDDPRLTAGSIDAALIVNAYHEMTEHEKMLERIRDALRPGGRLVVIEPTRPSLESASREAQAKEHVISASIVADELRKAGFEIAVRNDRFSEARGEHSAMWLILARRK